MIVLNFAHPMTSRQKEQIEELTRQSIDAIHDIPVQFDDQQPFEPQFEQLIARLPVAADALQTEAVLVNLPSLNFIAALLLAELHGRMGYFPPVVRLRPMPGVLPPQFEIVEVLDLQAVRNQARKKRFDE